VIFETFLRQNFFIALLSDFVLKNVLFLKKELLDFFPIIAEFTKLLVAGGRSPFHKLRTVEVIDLDPSDGSKVCQSLPDLPKNLEGAIGHLFNGTTPVICGGYGPINVTSKIRRGENPYGILCECFSLINGSWIYGSQVCILSWTVLQKDTKILYL